MASAGSRPVWGARRAWEVVLVALVLGGCAGSSPAPPSDDAARLTWAREAIGRGEAGDVVLRLREFLADRPGSRYAEEARLLLGRALYEDGNDAEAEVEFEGIVRDFPGGEFAAEARYYLALSLLSQSRGPQLEQTETRRAENEFQLFLQAYPDHPLAEKARKHLAEIHEKLGKKEFLNGRLYLQRGNHAAARFYFKDKVLVDYGDTRWAPGAMLGLARSYAKTKDWKEAARWGCELRSKFPTSDEAGDAKEILAEAAKLGFTCDGDSGKEGPPAASIPNRRR